MFNVLFLLFLLIVQILSQETNRPICFVPCPANEEFGYKKCNGCEPSCDKPKPEICTKIACPCSCDCKPGLFRNTKTGKCVEKCSYNAN
ncbi:hypothetical protein niasHT_010713 [Heterodera trifolii]|uniref:TIL domain-containing protein n=1 Tax=Heterodera trifolii TaxID=157864 RepID=A0ABD2L691_9BILA